MLQARPWGRIGSVYREARTSGMWRSNRYRQCPQLADCAAERQVTFERSGHWVDATSVDRSIGIQNFRTPATEAKPQNFVVPRVPAFVLPKGKLIVPNYVSSGGAPANRFAARVCCTDPV
jgi:hypothetical protein